MTITIHNSADALGHLAIVEPNCIKILGGGRPDGMDVAPWKHDRSFVPCHVFMAGRYMC